MRTLCSGFVALALFVWDVRKTATDGAERTALLERVQEQDGAKDNVQERAGNDEAVDRCRGHLSARDFPHEQREPRGHEVGERHGAARRPSKNDEKECDREDGGQ